MKSSHGALVAALAASLFAACAASPVPPAADAPGIDASTTPVASDVAAPTPAGPVPEDELGGRLFDHLVRGGSSVQGFEPDASKTKGTADGRGGPKGDGTLLLGTGAPLLNDAGHDYRLKNLFGWDLRGKEGIYGPKYMNKSFVVSKNLLAGKESKAELAALLEKGDAEIPAFGPVLDAASRDAIAAFVIGVRDGALPHPDSIFELREKTPGNYALRVGGDVARGKTIFAERCAKCHGSDGTGMYFDDGEYSLGSHARQKAYEDWAKIVSGQPDSAMTRQVKGATGKAMAQEVLDVLAALCDRTAFPRGKASKDDVADGDARCGAYLK
jgi:cytochrome c553